jgi:hypothetical protein
MRRAPDPHFKLAEVELARCRKFKLQKSAMLFPSRLLLSQSKHARYVYRADADTVGTWRVFCR